jgi:hypothetical protein
MRAVCASVRVSCSMALSWAMIVSVATVSGEMVSAMTRGYPLGATVCAPRV